METRTKDLARDGRRMAREAQETAEAWSQRTMEVANAAMETAKAAYHAAHDKAIAGAKATDKVIRANPYKSLGIAFGVGVLLGFLLKKK